MIDLRSDTVSRPSMEMRRAMADAPVGDDVYGDDPSVRALEQRTAQLLGKDDAVYMVSGTMTNQVALRAHTESGDEVIADAAAHIAVLERGAPAALSGITIRPLRGLNGIFSADDVRAAVRLPHPFLPATQPPLRLVCLENTHNLGGGTVWPIGRVLEVAAVARTHGLKLHLDGARLWNASVASGVSEADYAAAFDTVSVCFSKGLGAPMGSALAGSHAMIARARRFKALFGGGFRQGGIVAAGALYALDYHRARLRDDHARAAQLARRLAAMPGIAIDVAAVQTNIVRFRLETIPAAAFVDYCFAAGVHLLPAGPAGVRAVVHLDVGDEEIERAADVISLVLKRAAA
ncbi:MAG: DegT/DnrJ/EryC1/StrS family aminotransferase [Rhodospirillales bacterium]|nr:DegT/DnrJ/EryC1/StrS family aminotransferase [Rhodospirillales bacterium]